jgi:hypothetical protein
MTGHCEGLDSSLLRTDSLQMQVACLFLPTTEQEGSWDTRPLEGLDWRPFALTHRVTGWVGRVSVRAQGSEGGGRPGRPGAGCHCRDQRGQGARIAAGPGEA